MADNWLKLWNERQLLDAQPDVVPMDLDNDSDTDRFLARLNLAYIPSICSIACIECSQLVIPSHLGIAQTIKTHLVDKHGIKSKAANTFGLKESLKDLNIATEAELKQQVEAMINTESPPAIPHLKLYYGWSCPVCVHYRTNENSMKTHVSKQHTGTKGWKKMNNPRDPGNRAWVQEVLAVMGRRVVKVAPPNVNVVDDAEDFQMVVGEKKFDFAAEKKKMMEDFVRASMPKQDEQRNSNRVTTWEERMQWNTYGSIELLNEMRALINKDNNDIDLRRIKDAVIKALRTGLADIVRTDPFTLKQLKSPGITVGLRPFRTKQEDSTHKRYFSYWSDMFIFFYQLLQDEEKEEKSGIKFAEKVKQCFFNLHTIISGDVYGEQEENAAAALCVEISFELMSVQFPQKLMSNPLLNYVAVMSWNTRESGFHLVNNVTPRLAGFIFSARTMILRQVWMDVDAIVSESPGLETTPVVRQLMDNARKYIVDFEPYPMGELISTLALGKAINTNSWIAGNVVWEKDGKGLRYKGEYFGLNEYRSMVHQLTEEAERLAKQLLFQDTLPDLDLDSIADDHSNGTAGYSYVFDFRNDFEGYFQYLMNKIETEPELRNRFTVNGVLKTVECLRYLQLAQKFLRVMAALMHHTGGLPPRGTEMMDVSTCNLGMGEQRAIYIYAGNIMVVTHYNKTMAMTGMAKIIPRFLPNSVSKLLVIYQLFITPFVNYLTRETAHIVDPSPYLFVDHTRNTKWTAEEYSTLLGNFGKDLMDFELKIARHRQIISSISKRCMELLAAWEDHVADRWMASVHQFGHGKRVDDLYGLEADMMTSLTARAIEQYRAISRQVHHFLGIKSYSATPWYLGPYHIMPEGWMPEDADFGVQPQPQQQLRPAQIPQAQQQHLPPPPPPPPLPPVRTHQRQVPPEVYAGLQANHFNMERATFSSQGQANACRMIYEKVNPLLIILKTGNGKTDNILTVSKIPTAEMKTLTILILPFKGACIDVASRAASRDIPVHFWTADASAAANEAKAPKQWGIIVVTPETAGTSPFRVWVAARISAGCIGRIVFDEVHELVLAEAYRSFQNVKILVKNSPVQLVLMSATVPPTMTYAIKDFFRLDSLIECRSETNRYNIIYWVFEVDNPFQRVMEMVQGTWPNEKKILIFCRLKQATKAIKKAIEEEMADIPCYAFHADMSDDEKKETLEMWNKTGGVLAATTSFGSAIDTKNLALVMGLGAPYSLAEYIQQSGRGGREGQETTAILFHTRDELDALRIVDYGGRAWKNADRLAKLEYMSTKGCRRVAISSYVDNEVAECRSSPDFVWCDNCSNLHEETTDAKPPQLATARSVIVSFFEYCVEGSCVICSFLSYTGSYDGHETDECPWLVGAEDWVNKYKPTDQNHACYRCGLPPSVCTPQTCRFQNRALHNLAFFAISDSEVRDRLKNELDLVDCPLDSLYDWMQYLQCSAEFEGRKVTNLWSLAVALYKLGLFPLVD